MANQTTDNIKDAPLEEEDPLPEGYLEALEVHKQLAIDLLDKAINGPNDCCCDCAFWVGRCLKGKINRIAWDPACEDFNRA